MAKRAKTTIDWLRNGQDADDLSLLRQLISEATENDLSHNQMNTRAFERHYGLDPIPMTPLPDDLLNKLLYFKEANEIDGMDDSITPRGTTLQTQIQSLLPSAIAAELKSSLTYVLSRAIAGNIPDPEEWMWHPKSATGKKSKDTRRKRMLWPIPLGLDSLTASLLTVLVLSRLLKQDIHWIPAIWQYHIEQVRSNNLRQVLSRLTTSITVRDTRDVLLEAIGAIRNDVPNEPVARDLLDAWLPLLATFDDHAKLSECRITDAVQGDGGPASARSILRQGILARVGSGISGVRTQFSPSSEWGVLSIRADGPTGGFISRGHSDRIQRWRSGEGLLDVLRRDLRILAYNPVRKILTQLSNSEIPGRPTAKDIIKSTGLKGRAAYYTLNNLGLVLHERYILDPTIIGLKYRYIFSPRRKPLLRSKGLAERMTIADALHSSLTIHLEPVDSSGPKSESFPSGMERARRATSIQLTATQEVISMRMGLFNTETGAWSIAFQETEPTRPEKSPLWLYRETSGKVKPKLSLSPREIDLIGVLCVLRGNSSVRRWLLQKLEYPARTTSEILPKLMKNRITRLLYLPALEYVGLSNGLIIGARFSSTRDLNEFIDRSMVASPYAQIRFDSNEKSAIALIRTPHLQGTSIDGFLGQWLDGIDAEYVSGTMERRRTYWLTVLNRLYQKPQERWIDPWEVH
ncbi:MAG: hypothetical protein EAX95_07140 [Candidatus Thorarchaeota archaeon]|nr:hypothetical protein [Candidatus Thorarchaeota archaeon]